MEYLNELSVFNRNIIFLYFSQRQNSYFCEINCILVVSDSMRKHIFLLQTLAGNHCANLRTNIKNIT